MTLPASYPDNFYPDQTYPDTPVIGEVVPDLLVPSGIAPTLGQEQHRAFVFDRGGSRMIFEIPDITMSRFRRRRDDIGDATILVKPRRRECVSQLGGIGVGRHELVIFRGRKRAWEGPITRLNLTGDQVEIAAHDICHYLSRTIMRRSYDNRYSKTNNRVGPITRRAQVILNIELARKESLSPPVNILRYLDVRTETNTTKTSRLTLAYQSSVWEELDYMAAKLGLDYTVLGRRLIINDVYYVLGRTPRLSDKDFGDPLNITFYGMELCTRSAVTDGEGHWAAVGGIDPYYGEVELLHNSYGEDVAPTSTEPTQAEIAQLVKAMASQAQRNLAGRYPTPVILRASENTLLDSRAPITFDMLIPGMRIPVTSTRTLIPLTQEQKLDAVTAEATESGEQITVTLSPSPGTSPWDASVDLPELEE